MGRRRTIAVASELGNVRAQLRDKGYTVVDLEDADLSQVDAVIVSGVSDNLTGVHDIETQAPVITAAGLSAGEVAEVLAGRLELQ